MSNVDELVASSATEVEEGSTTDADSATFDEQGAVALALDQGLTQLLYELAVRLPAQSEIQVLCVWLYEPVHQTIRLHALRAELPAKLKPLSREDRRRIALYSDGSRPTCS